MARKLQIVVLASLAASAFAGAVRADGPSGLVDRVFQGMGMGPQVSLFANAADANHHATAGATVHANRNWDAKLFVSWFDTRGALDREGLRLQPSSTVGAQLSGWVARDTRVSFDVFNVFDRRVNQLDPLLATRNWTQGGALDNYLFHPAEGRGFRVSFTRYF